MFYSKQNISLYYIYLLLMSAVTAVSAWTVVSGKEVDRFVIIIIVNTVDLWSLFGLFFCVCVLCISCISKSVYVCRLFIPFCLC